jgi:hypothetical protein
LRIYLNTNLLNYHHLGHNIFKYYSVLCLGMFVSKQDRIRKRAQKYYPENWKAWVFLNRSPHVEKKALYDRNIETIDQKIRFQQSVISEVRKRTEEEISILARQANTQAQLDAKKLTKALTDQLIVKVKIVNELHEEKMMEYEAFKLALTRMMLVSKVLIWTYSLLFFAGGVIWIFVQYKKGFNR